MALAARTGGPQWRASVGAVGTGTGLGAAVQAAQQPPPAGRLELANLKGLGPWGELQPSGGGFVLLQHANTNKEVPVAALEPCM